MLAGVAFLPMAAALFVAARSAPKLLPKFGPKRVMIVGALADTTYVGGVLVPLMLFGVGIGFSFMPLNMVILSGLQPRDIGSASGILQTVQQIGGSVGLAVLVTIFGEGGRGVGDARVAQTSGTSAAFVGGTVFALLALAVVVFAIRIPSRKPAEGTA